MLLLPKSWEQLSDCRSPGTENWPFTPPSTAFRVGTSLLLYQDGDSTGTFWRSCFPLFWQPLFSMLSSLWKCVAFGANRNSCSGVPADSKQFPTVPSPGIWTVISYKVFRDWIAWNIASKRSPLLASVSSSSTSAATSPFCAQRRVLTRLGAGRLEKVRGCSSSCYLRWQSHICDKALRCLWID